MLLEAIEWLGHSGFRVAAGRASIYIDPYRVAAEQPKADLILVTHQHYDHFSIQDLERLRKDDTRVLAPAAVVERLEGNVHAMRAGEVVETDLYGVDVRAVPAYNTSKRDGEGRLFHPREAGCLGYELNVRGARLYHAGDTDVIPEMDWVVGAEVALLPVSGVHVMTALEAAEAARRIQPTVAVPMHWGGHIGSEKDAQTFADAAPVDVVIMRPAVAA
ncbi:MAG TPA: MBL fold metallo-hydrolase [Thermoleophilaceae bacterium]|jgi:L-ascorbate metabolism protein UlaG (beta-lactamase superfamily)|nr:MBL fold metallo-hydrolase [Thermoleophilaceae bacterium]